MPDADRPQAAVNRRPKIVHFWQKQGKPELRPYWKRNW